MPQNAEAREADRNHENETAEKNQAAANREEISREREARKRERAREKEREKQLATRLYNVRGSAGLGRSEELLEKDALRYQEAHEKLKASEEKAKYLDLALKRIQGLDAPNPGVTEFVDTRKNKLKGNQGQLFIEFVKSQHQVNVSEELLLPRDGYAGAAASHFDREAGRQLQQSQRRVNQLHRQVSQQLVHIRDITKDLQEARSKLLVKEQSVQELQDENQELKAEIQSLKWEACHPAKLHEQPGSTPDSVQHDDHAAAPPESPAPGVELEKLADDTIRSNWLKAAAVAPSSIVRRLKGGPLLVRCGVCQSPVVNSTRVSSMPAATPTRTSTRI